jgi:hypothetical protein
MTPGLIALAALLAAAPESPAGPGSAAAFGAAVREATSRYHDREVAIADGYRLIGGDFPAMGEHWLNIGLLFGRRHDPTRPEFLTYVSVQGTPRLTGVAYAVPLLTGESPPEGPFAGVRWHDHASTIDEETLIPHGEHAGHGGGDREADAPPRLAMAHAGVWLTNPAGDFAADNWAIPYFRLGLETPAEAPVACAKALALVSGGASHLAAVVEAAGARAPSERGAVHRALERAQRSVREALHGTHGRLDAAQLARLAETWARLWKDLDRALPLSTRSRLQAAR